MDAIGGRKVGMALVVAVVGVTVTFFKGDIPTNLLALLQVVFGAFVVGNGVEHLAVARSSTSAEPEAPPAPVNYVDMAPLTDAMGEVLRGQARLQESVELSQQGLARIIELASPRKPGAPAT